MSLVSIIIPTYNAENFIKDTIQSVTAQSYQHIEIIVIDDCSKDSTRDIVRKLSLDNPKINLISLEQNMGGPAGPRNIGIRKASGDWICFLDADDIWHSSKLSVQLQALKSTGYLFCCTDKENFVKSEDYDVLRVIDKNLKFRKYGFYDQCSKNRIVNSSVLIDASLIKKTPFNEDPDYIAVEDMHCWLQILESIDCLSIADPLVGYRINKGQISGNKLIMAKKFFMVLSRYNLKSRKSLGMYKYFYFTKYCYISVLDRLTNLVRSLIFEKFLNKD